MKKTKTKLFASALVAAVIVVAAASAWSFSSVERLLSASKSLVFTVDCEFDQFRQIMVRKNATAVIIGQSGMTLIDERIDDLTIDTSGDNRPLLNALRGRSQSDLTAVKQITVRLDDPALEAGELVLRQRAEVEPDNMRVTTESKRPAGNLKYYASTLSAKPTDVGTEVSLVVKMDVQVRVPRLFARRADAEVQKATVHAIDGQTAAIQQFVAEYADKRLILPDL